MADCAIVSWRVKAVLPKTFTISGTVKNGSGSGLQRRVIVYRNGIETEVVGSATSSAGTGAFAITVNGNTNDEFKVEVIGADGENTVVFDHVRPE